MTTIETEALARAIIARVGSKSPIAHAGPRAGDLECSVLDPTYPNREYLLSGQSGGNKSNAFPPTNEGWQWDSIVDRLVRAGVSTGDYATDFPPLALFGIRNTPYIHTIADYFQDAQDGRLPQVTFVDPRFVGDQRSDDHPLGDPRAAQRFVQSVFSAFARSPQWKRGRGRWSAPSTASANAPATLRSRKSP